MASRLARVLLAFAVAAGSTVLTAQTTDGFAGGLLRDSVEGGPLAGGVVVCENAATNTRVTARSGTDGTFGLPLLPPGQYRIHVEEPGHQSVEIQNLELPVAGMIYLDLRMRPLSDVWERGQYRSVFLPGSRTLAVFYGPDVDTSFSGNFDPPATSTGRLDTSISDVIPAQLINELPLQGRDVYTALVMEPGVTSDSSTSRGIGVAVNGQRPSSSNFLLDGAENNNSLISGPLLTPAPESIQEFRFSIANFSAEYGRTAGFVVNAVTRSGGAHWHGLGYLDANRAGFNANDFQSNASGAGRLPFTQNDFGINAGGPAPARKHWLFLDTSLDFLRSLGDQDPETLFFPSPYAIAQAAATNPTTYGVLLMERYPAPAGVTTPGGLYSISTLTPTTTVHRFTGFQRFDIAPPDARHQLSVRLAGGLVSEPDFIWSPYKGFSTALADRTGGINGNLRTALSPNLTNEFRVAWTYDNLAFPRPHPEIPNLITDDAAPLPDGKTLGGGAQLPQAGILYGYQNRFGSGEFSDSVTRVFGRQIFKFGGDLLWRQIGGYLGLGGGGELTFENVNDFLTDNPVIVELGIDRIAYNNGQGPFQAADFNRAYRNIQIAFFAEDSVRLTDRLSMNFGLRYDNFGVPVNTGPVKDALVQLGAGPDIETRIANATLSIPSGEEKLFSAANNDWAGRFGFSYAAGPGGNTVIRGGYGMFYDRSFDNLWEDLALNNVLLYPGFFPTGFNYIQPLTQALSSTLLKGDTSLDQLFMYQPNLRTPYVHTFFFGVQRQIARGVLFETNYTGSLGHKLITTDIFNRTPCSTATSGSCLPEILYRGNQGNSSYNALTVKISGTVRSATFRLAYTWSHSIDNQSEPLAGEFDDLSPTNLSASNGTTGVAAFTRQFDSAGDRGNSDFDQRHNLVGMGTWQLPGMLRGWRISGLGALRSGLPYTVYASSLGAPLYNQRADLIDPSAWQSNQPAIGGGGIQLLNPAAFQVPAAGAVGNTGRNAFPGPGFFSADASLSRSIHFKRLPESDRLIFRVDAFNFLNHVNLNDPQAVALVAPAPGANSDFGVALYGRTSVADGSPVLTPLKENARQIHVILRLEF